jgi:hypothetical protein
MCGEVWHESAKISEDPVYACFLKYTDISGNFQPQAQAKLHPSYI